MPFGRQRLLFHAHVHQAVDVGDVGLDLVGDLVHTAQIGAEQLDGDVGARAGKHMVDAVTQRLPHGGGDARNGRQTCADVFHKRLARTVEQRKLDINFRAVGGLGVFVQLPAPRAARGAPHFGNLQQLGLDQIAHLMVLVQRDTGLGHDGNRKRTFIEIGQETVSERSVEVAGPQQQHEGGSDYGFLMVERPIQRAGITPGEPTRKPALFLLLREVFLGTEHIAAEQRRDRHGDEERHQQRYDIGYAQRLEHPAFHARQEKQRDERDDDDECGVEDGGAYFCGSTENHFFNRLPLAPRQLVVLAQPLINVFNVDDGVVNERTDGDAHAAQRHRVDVHAQQVEHDHRAQERERNGQHRNERGAETAQKQEQDNDDEDRAFQQRTPHIVDRSLDKVGLLEDFGIQNDVGRQGGLEFGHTFFDIACNFQRVDVRLFRNG